MLSAHSKTIYLTMSKYFEDAFQTQIESTSLFSNKKQGDKISIFHQCLGRKIDLDISFITSDHIYGRYHN